MTQAERIYDYMERFGSITPMEAFADLGVTKLATRISEMRASGLVVNKELVKTKNRFGESVHYMKYSLPDYMQER